MLMPQLPKPFPSRKIKILKVKKPKIIKRRVEKTKVSESCFNSLVLIRAKLLPCPPYLADDFIIYSKKPDDL